MLDHIKSTGSTPSTPRKRTRSIAPPPAYLAACRLVLGDDRPATVFGAIIDNDPRMAIVEALAVRDPKQWLCSAIDKNGIPPASRRAMASLL